MWLLQALGVEVVLAMVGAGSGAASASSDAGPMLGDSGAASSGPAGRSIHGHMAMDGEEMEDALLRSQMEWLERHSEGCVCAQCTLGVGGVEGRSVYVGSICHESIVVAPSRARFIWRCPRAADGWALDQAAQAGIPMAFEQSEKMHNEAMRLLEERTGGIGRGTEGWRGGIIQPLPNQQAMRAGYAAARAAEAKARGHTPSWAPLPAWVANRASPEGVGWNMVLSQCGNHIVYEPEWQTIWPPRNNWEAWVQLAEIWNEAVRAGVNPSPQFVRGQETLEELVARSNSVGEAVDGFARPRASYMAVETEDDGTFNPMFVHWNTTHRAGRGPRVPDMPVQLRLAEAREAKQRFEAARASTPVATLAATHTATAAGPLQGHMGDAAARPAVAALASGRGLRLSSGPAAAEASVAVLGVGGTLLPKGERSRSRTRMEGEDEVGSVAAVAAGPAGQEASPPGIAAGAAGGSQGSSERVSRAAALGSTQSPGRSLSRSSSDRS